MEDAIFSPDPASGSGANNVAAYVRISALGNPALPPETLRRAVDEVPSALRFALRHPACPDDILRKYAGSDDAHVRSSVAYNPSLPDDLAREMTFDESSYVRRAVAAHPALTESDLLRLASDTCAYTRATVARRKGLTVPVMEALVASGGTSPLRQLVKQKNVPEHILLRVRALLPRNRIAKERIARHPNTPVEVIEEMVMTEQKSVVAAAAGNTNCPDHIRAFASISTAGLS